MDRVYNDRVATIELTTIEFTTWAGFGCGMAAYSTMKQLAEKLGV
jgi:hypothetical protein